MKLFTLIAIAFLVFCLTFLLKKNKIAYKLRSFLYYFPTYTPIKQGVTHGQFRFCKFPH